MKKKVDPSQLQPEIDAAVQAFRAELVREREEQERRLHVALEHFKNELDRLRRETEIEAATQRRLIEIFSAACGLPNDDRRPPATPS